MRQGEHSNTAFGLALVLDYTRAPQVLGQASTLLFPHKWSSCFDSVFFIRWQTRLLRRGFWAMPPASTWQIGLRIQFLTINLWKSHLSTRCRSCPISYEPSGTDFLSPCIQVFFLQKICCFCIIFFAVSSVWSVLPPNSIPDSWKLKTSSSGGRSYDKGSWRRHCL